jgi:cyclin A
MLKALGYQLTVPTSYSFLEIYCVLTDTPEQVRYLAEYLCELTLYSAFPWMVLLPSKIATAALVLANYLLDRKKIWNESLAQITKHEWNDIKNVVLDLNDVHKEAINLKEKAIQEKYVSSRYMRVALLPSKEINGDNLDGFIKNSI